jgi:hypothetical protein
MQRLRDTEADLAKEQSALNILLANCSSQFIHDSGSMRYRWSFVVFLIDYWLHDSPGVEIFTNEYKNTCWPILPVESVTLTVMRRNSVSL